MKALQNLFIKPEIVKVSQVFVYRWCKIRFELYQYLFTTVLRLTYRCCKVQFKTVARFPNNFSTVSRLRFKLYQEFATFGSRICLQEVHKLKFFPLSKVLFWLVKRKILLRKNYQSLPVLLRLICQKLKTVMLTLP